MVGSGKRSQKREKGISPLSICDLWTLLTLVMVEIAKVQGAIWKWKAPPFLGRQWGTAARWTERSWMEELNATWLCSVNMTFMMSILIMMMNDEEWMMMNGEDDEWWGLQSSHFRWNITPVSYPKPLLFLLKFPTFGDLLSPFSPHPLAPQAAGHRSFSWGSQSPKLRDLMLTKPKAVVKIQQLVGSNQLRN